MNFAGGLFRSQLNLLSRLIVIFRKISTWKKNTFLKFAHNFLQNNDTLFLMDFVTILDTLLLLKCNCTWIISDCINAKIIYNNNKFVMKARLLNFNTLPNHFIFFVPECLQNLTLTVDELIYWHRGVANNF